MIRGNRLDDKYFRWIGIPLLSVLYTTAVNLPAVVEENRLWWKQYLTDFIFVFICWSISREIIRVARRWFPGVPGTRKRVAFLFISTVLVSLAEGFLIVAFLNYTRYYKVNFSLFDFFYTSGLILVFTLMIIAIYESFYSISAWNHMRLEAETLKRQNLQSQLESLKDQIKPHFLFNSLSTLIGLIDEDKERSKKFVEELAFVYRYLLQSSDRNLIPLSEELDFIKAYYYLLKTRFEDRLLLDIYVGNGAAQQLIPPLTLQILLENAAKHNVISSDNPLRVVIQMTGEHELEVVNNLQRKTPAAPSTRTGLAHLAAKYTFLQLSEPQIFETADQFKVRVALIPNASS
jgi:LytS/YehU family sensor histidine kinase